MEGHPYKSNNLFCWQHRTVATLAPKLRAAFCRLNPFNWSLRTLRISFAAFFLIALPLYLFIGLQPALPADAAEYPTLEIPALNLTTPVSPVELVDHQLATPAYIAGSFSQHENKTLLIGHSSTVFKTLHFLSLGDTFTYDNATYIVTRIETLEKSAIKMSEVLASTPVKTLIIMTCAGNPLPHQDATHRLLITAEQAGSRP